MPVVVSAGFMLVFGYLAHNVFFFQVERQMEKITVKRIREFILLAFIFGLVVVMIPFCFYLWSSYFWGHSSLVSLTALTTLPTRPGLTR